MQRNPRIGSTDLFFALILLVLGGCNHNPNAHTNRITIKGSDTMVNLMSDLAEEYAHVQPRVGVAVTGGGSGTGIAALINGTTDICASSRAINATELNAATARSVSPQRVTLGLDGIAVMVNSQNPVSELALDQLKKIYTGEYDNWRDVGGPDQSILVLTRESSSGTFLFFRERVLNNADYASTVLMLPSNAAVTKAVTESAAAIGYGGLAYAEQSAAKILRIRVTPDSVAVLPTVAAVQTFRYPITRPLYLYTNGEPAGNVKSFLEFCLSEAGQKIVTDAGFVTVPEPQ
jgi:phosphate transport system substrate-binding protein